MKKIMTIISVALLALTACNQQSEPVKVLAHRGNASTGSEFTTDENSLDALRRAQERDFDGIEFDVHLTADDQLVIHHDNMIPETLAFAPLGLGVVPYALPSSVELADATLELVRKHDVVLWEKHGTVAVGPDMMEAFDQTDVLNKAACIYMTGKNFGFTPEGMTAEAVKEIRTVFNLPDNRK